MRLDGRTSKRAGGGPVTVDGFFIDSQTLYVSRHTKPVRGIAPVRESSVVCMCVCVFVVHANIHIYMYIYMYTCSEALNTPACRSAYHIISMLYTLVFDTCAFQV